MCQPKLDGVRCYTLLVDGNIRMFSRNHKEFFNCKHIAEELAPIFKATPDIILDGELYNHALKHDFNKIISLVRTSKPSEANRKDAKDLMQYHVYDMFNPNNKDLKFNERDVWLSRMFLENTFDSVKPVKTWFVDEQHHVDALEERVLDEGYEGAMLRANQVYVHKRSHGLQKVKRFQDEEATVIEAVEGKGKLVGKLGKFMMRTPDGRVFGAPATAYKHAERETMWNNRNRYINTVWTYEFFELTPGGMPRFPILKGN